MLTIAADIPFVTRTSSNLGTTALEAVRRDNPGSYRNSSTRYALRPGRELTTRCGAAPT